MVSVVLCGAIPVSKLTMVWWWFPSSILEKFIGFECINNFSMTILSISCASWIGNTDPCVLEALIVD